MGEGRHINLCNVQTFNLFHFYLESTLRAGAFFPSVNPTSVSLNGSTLKQRPRIRPVAFLNYKSFNRQIGVKRIIPVLTLKCVLRLPYKKKTQLVFLVVVSPPRREFPCGKLQRHLSKSFLEDLKICDFSWNIKNKIFSFFQDDYLRLDFYIRCLLRPHFIVKRAFGSAQVSSLLFLISCFSFNHHDLWSIKKKREREYLCCGYQLLSLCA